MLRSSGSNPARKKARLGLFTVTPLRNHRSYSRYCLFAYLAVHMCLERPRPIGLCLPNYSAAMNRRNVRQIHISGFRHQGQHQQQPTHCEEDISLEQYIRLYSKNVPIQRKTKFKVQYDLLARSARKNAGQFKGPSFQEAPQVIQAFSKSWMCKNSIL